MPRPMAPARFGRPDDCPAGPHRPGDTDPAVLTSTGTVLCDAHAWMVVPDAIVARGPYREIRTKRTEIMKEQSRG